MTVSELYDDIDFLCGSTTATYSNANKCRNMNIAYRNVATIVWESDGGWRYDDSNATTMAKAYANLVHSQQDYTLPTTALRIARVEVMDKNGDWAKLKPLDAQDVTTGLPEYLGGNPGMPVYYELQGNSLLLYPSPASASVTLSGGVTVYVDRDVTSLTVSGTTASPGFATPFHRILSYAAAIDFTQDERWRQYLTEQKAKLEQRMVRFYSKRAPEVKSTIKSAGNKKWRIYL